MPWRSTDDCASTQTISPEVLASAARMALDIRSRSSAEMTHHQLPDAPPPPDEPPPPENPPPPPPPEHPPLLPELPELSRIFSTTLKKNQRNPGDTISSRTTTITISDDNPVESDRWPADCPAATTGASPTPMRPW